MITTHPLFSHKRSRARTRVFLPSPIPFTQSTVKIGIDVAEYEKYLFEEKRNSKTTIEGKILKRLAKRVNLWDSEAVEKYVQFAEMTNGHKNSILFAYADWCRLKGFSYSPKKYKREEKLPYIPTEEELDALIPMRAP